VSAHHLILVGMMGSGKSVVGRRVAQRLGRRFVDSDAQVEARTGRTVREIWEAEGEAAFRKLEAEALAEALAAEEPTVIAAAGGTVLDPDNRKAIEAGGTVIWLRAAPETLAARVGRRDHRPLLGDEPLEVLARLDLERASYYREVADAVVDVDDADVEDVAEAVLERAW